MRDVGLFVWVVLLIVGVIGSIAKSARRQMQAGGGPAPPQPPAPGRVIAQVKIPGQIDRIDRQNVIAQLQRVIESAKQPAPQPQPAPPPKPPPPPPPVRVEEPRPAPRRGLFGGRPEIVRAVIAAEVLGKPRAFGDESFMR